MIQRPYVKFEHINKGVNKNIEQATERGASIARRSFFEGSQLQQAKSQWLEDFTSDSRVLTPPSTSTNDENQNAEGMTKHEGQAVSSFEHSTFGTEGGKK